MPRGHEHHPHRLSSTRPPLRASPRSSTRRATTGWGEQRRPKSPDQGHPTPAKHLLCRLRVIDRSFRTSGNCSESAYLQAAAYLTRRTTCHARCVQQLENQLEMMRCYYNFLRPHRVLKFGGETRTPAMQAGLARRRLSFREIFTSPVILLSPKKIVYLFSRVGALRAKAA